MLPLTEPCISAEHIFLSGEKNRHKLNTLALLLKSGHLYLFDDLDIERYLVHSQSKSPPTLPRHIVASLPSFNSPVTSAKLYTSNGPILLVEVQMHLFFSLGFLLEMWQILDYVQLHCHIRVTFQFGLFWLRSI